MEQIIIVLASLLLSSAMFIFWIVKGGFNKKFLYTDNTILGVVSAFLSLGIFAMIKIPFPLMVIIVCPFIVFTLFVILFFYRFYRNPKRVVVGGPNDIVAPADGRIIYIKELESNQMPVSVKKMRMANISEITKTDILKQPCYLIGISMNFFDVHYNRAPIDGKIILLQHTNGSALGLNTPESTMVNERNTTVFERDDKILAGVVQIAARGVARCLVFFKVGDKLSRGQIFGKITFGSQTDLVIPRDVTILVREGEQVHAGITVIGKLNLPEGKQV